MKFVSRTVTVGVLALLGAGMASETVAGASSSSYPPVMGTVPAVPSPCTTGTSIPPVPADQLKATERAIAVLVGKHLTSLGQCGHGLLVVMLTPGSESLARQVRARFGPSVQLMVGLTVWNGHAGRSPTCGILATLSSTPAGYSADLDLSSRRIKVGENLAGHVALRNTGTQSVRVLTGQPIQVVITKPGTRRLVGIYEGAIAGTGYAPLLSPGQTQNVGIVGGTGRCDGGIGSALPPGHYDAVAEVSGVTIDGPMGGPGGGPPPTYFTDFVPIQIVR
jgi:hypothetical protein